MELLKKVNLINSVDKSSKIELMEEKINNNSKVLKDLISKREVEVNRIANNSVNEYKCDKYGVNLKRKVTRRFIKRHNI